MSKPTKLIAGGAVIFVLSIIIFAVVVNNKGTNQNADFLRIHIRANSNAQSDQDVKYKIKDAVVQMLTPLVSDCKTKEDAQAVIAANLQKIEQCAQAVLRQQGFDYGAAAKLNEEYFPVRAYGDVVLESGFYDALIIFLGEGTGDNWWCVVYPPLCFLGAEGEGEIYYKSKIWELIEGWKKTK